MQKLKQHYQHFEESANDSRPDEQEYFELAGDDMHERADIDIDLVPIDSSDSSASTSSCSSGSSRDSSDLDESESESDVDKDDPLAAAGGPVGQSGH